MKSLSINIFEFDEAIHKQILSKYERDTATFAADVEKVRKWIENQPHLPEIPNKKIIAAFLMLNKCRVERTKEKLDMFYTIRTLLPDFFQNTNPNLPHMKMMIEQIYWIPLPKLTLDHCKIFVFKLSDPHTFSELNPCMYFSLTFSLGFIRMMEDCSLGDILIYDMKGLTLSHLSKMTPLAISKANMIYEKVYSSPLRAIHFVNSPGWIHTIISAIQSVLKPKLAQRIHVHRGVEDLHRFVPKDNLPEDYGGRERPLKELNDILKLKYEEYKSKFDELDTMKVKEDLRPQKLKDDELLGFHGNFTKLNID